MLDFVCLEQTVNSPTDYYGKFALYNLDRDEGITIGNLLRRVLLTKVPTLTIVQLRMGGMTKINHEFTTIPGVREDVLEVMLNLKEVVFKSDYLRKSVGRFCVDGPAIVTPAHFVLDPDIEVLNPNQYIASVAANARFELEFTLDRGSGYTLAENENEVSYPVKTIPPLDDYLKLDTLHMPVRGALFTVESHRFFAYDSWHNKERLFLDIYTNGSITPLAALIFATQAILEWFQSIEYGSLQKLFELDELLPEKCEDIPDVWLPNSLPPFSDESEDESPPLPSMEDLLSQSPETSMEEGDLPIEALHFSTRTTKALKKAKIHRLDDLLTYSKKDLQQLKNMGKKSVQEVVQTLEEAFGLSLP